MDINRAEREQQRYIVLIDELRAQTSENALVEFKENNTDKEMIGRLCSALANAARVDNQDFAYVVWGIRDSDHAVIGTSFEPDKQTVNNQGFQIWLAQRLKPSIAFSFRTIQHPAGKVVLLEIPAATTAPVEFDKTAYIRIGSATPRLADYPDRFRCLVDQIRPYAWEKDIAKTFVTDDEILELLDYPAYFRLTHQRLPDNRKGIFERLQADQLIVRDVGTHWKITNLGAILFATNLENFKSSLLRKAVRLIAYDGKNKAATVKHRKDMLKGYANGFEELIGYINTLLPHNEHIGAALREVQQLFPELAIRELIANALIHQDMTISGAGPQIELFSDRLEITNPGTSLIQPERMIDLPPRSRNEALASLMRRMNMCEEQGSGIDKVIIHIELFQLPPPKFHSTDHAMQVVLYSPRPFADMTPAERIRACYQHTVIKYLSGDRMKNSSLCERFGIDSKNAAQASHVIRMALAEHKIKVADPNHPRAGYIPEWA